MITAHVFDDRRCALGEGPLWHPERQQLFWFDVLEKKLLSQKDGTLFEWRFDEMVSAAGWVGRDALLIASETGLSRFDLDTGKAELVHPMEADNPMTRSNDGRADPWGGFWIGTMGKQSEPGAGAIYRFYKGELRRLFEKITISNAICFAPDRSAAFFTDTITQKIQRQALDDEGWPDGMPEVWIDLGPERLYPDGAVVDAHGGLWNAQWGASRVARYTPDGKFDTAVGVAGRHSSCPAFGGADLKTLFVTSAADGLPESEDNQGVVFATDVDFPGVPEPRVDLS